MALITERDQNTKVQRAWGNRLEGINNLLSWMYETDVLNKGEKGKKDTIFRQYYRYYNDGDAPRGVLRKYSLSMYNKKLVEIKLEQYVEDFICTILNKYKGKYDKTEYLRYRKNTSIEKVATYVEYGYELDTSDLEVIKDEAVVSEINELNERATFLRNMVVEENADFSSYSLSYIIENANVTEADLDEYAVVESRKLRLAKKVRTLKTEKDV